MNRNKLAYVMAVGLGLALLLGGTDAQARNNRNRGNQIKKSPPPKTIISKTTLVGSIKSVDAKERLITVTGHFPVVREGRDKDGKKKVDAAMKDTTKTFKVPVSCKIVTRAKPVALLAELKAGDEVSVTFDDTRSELTALTITPPQN